MVDRIAPAPTLSPTAAPVDRFVAPVQQEAKPSFMADVAGALSELNPALQKYMSDTRAETAAAEEAEGAQAESGVDARFRFEQGRDSWRKLIDSERKRDQENGTNNADRIAGASPYFRRGLMKSRLNRIGMGLNDHLMNLWRENPQIETAEGVQNLHDVDDPAALQAWVTANTSEYTDRFGVSNMDPLLVGETLLPRVTAAQDGFLSRHTEFRLQRYNEEYMTEMSMNLGMVMAGGGTNASPAEAFINRLGRRESSSDYGRVNSEGYFGFLQWGDDRLTDYNRAHGTNITKEQFLASEAIQRAANIWHIQDIDAHIADKGYLDKGYSLDGMRAVAHLGGKGGLDDFVTKGANYKDKYGTRLMDYYNEFSGPTAEVQEILANGRADGMNPSQLNKAVVDSIILTARQTGNTAVLGMLNQIDTGSGPVGNILWVKEAVLQAEQQIEAANYTRDQRAAAAETAARKEVATQMKTSAMRDLLADPYTPLDDMKQAALDLGDPTLAEDMIDLQKKLIDADFDVRTNHEEVADIRIGISTGDLSKDEAIDRIRQGTGVLFPSNVALQLMDDLDRGDETKELVNDRIVQTTIGQLKDIIGTRFQKPSLMPGVPAEKGVEQAIEAERWMTLRLDAWKEANPDATMAEGRAEADRLFDLAVKGSIFQAPPDNAAPTEARPYGELAASQDVLVELVQLASSVGLDSEQGQKRIYEMATAEGLTALQFMQKYGIAPTQ